MRLKNIFLIIILVVVIVAVGVYFIDRGNRDNSLDDSVKVFSWQGERGFFYIENQNNRQKLGFYDLAKNADHLAFETSENTERFSPAPVGDQGAFYGDGYIRLAPLSDLTSPQGEIETDVDGYISEVFWSRDGKKLIYVVSYRGETPSETVMQKFYLLDVAGLSGSLIGERGSGYYAIQGFDEKAGEVYLAEAFGGGGLIGLYGLDIENKKISTIDEDVDVALGGGVVFDKDFTHAYYLQNNSDESYKTVEEYSDEADLISLNLQTKKSDVLYRDSFSLPDLFATTENKLIFSKRSDDLVEVYALDMFGGAPDILTSQGDDFYFDATSPDGGYLLFSRTIPEKVATLIYDVTTDTQATLDKLVQPFWVGF